jgi:hypothetical protein
VIVERSGRLSSICLLVLISSTLGSSVRRCGRRPYGLALSLKYLSGFRCGSVDGFCEDLKPIGV